MSDEQINIEAITQITEAEMNSFAQTFDKWRNAIVEGSKLAHAFSELQKQVQELKQQVEASLEANKRLDDMYVNARRQRDEAWAETATLRADLNETKHNLQAVQQQVVDVTETKEHDAKVAKDRIQSLEEQVQTLTKERDQSIAESLEWEEKAKRFRQSLDVVRAKLADVTTSLGLPEPEDTTATPSSEPEKDEEPQQPQQPIAYGVYGSQQPRDPSTQQFRPWDHGEEKAAS